MKLEELEERLRDAHESHDGAALAQLYADAAALSERQGRIDEACFRYTQAYVHALEHGLEPLATDVRSKLQHYGREEA